RRQQVRARQRQQPCDIHRSGYFTTRADTHPKLNPHRRRLLARRPRGHEYPGWAGRSATRGIDRRAAEALEVDRECLTSALVRQSLGGSNEHSYHEGWGGDILQGLGPQERATHRLPSWLAIEHIGRAHV